MAYYPLSTKVGSSSYPNTMAVPLARGMVVLGGSSTPELTEQIARYIYIDHTPLDLCNIYSILLNARYILGVLGCQWPNLIYLLIVAMKLMSTFWSPSEAKTSSSFKQDTGTYVHLYTLLYWRHSYSELSPVYDNIMEMLIVSYACKTSSARKIIAVMPYLPYSKQCMMKRRGCITAKLVAAMMSRAGTTSHFEIGTPL